jgi:dihydrofolate reductase
MRRIIAGLFISLDGVTEAPERWQSAYMNQELGEHLGATMAAADSLLLGRRTYLEWAAFWPQQSSEVPFADQINGIPKLVASTTLDTVEWQNSTLISGNVAERLDQLKHQDGKDIVVNGSATLVRSLLRDGLLDELGLLLHPVIVGSGQRLFDGLKQSALKLKQSSAFSNGVVSLTFQPSQP